MSIVYCTYLTVYFGNKFPMFYVGSTSVSNIEKGYRGSVSSNKYKKLWQSELKNYPELFKTKIISIHISRKEALLKENFFHQKLNVVKSNLYINMAEAIPNGKFGQSCSGINNPMYGKIRKDAKQRMSVSNPMKNPENISKMVASKNLLRQQGQHKSTRNSKNTLLNHSIRMKKDNPGNTKCCCLCCKIVTTPSGLTRYHKHIFERNT